AWTGHPATKPSLVATRAGAKTKLFMSWNGATQVRRWAILAGSSKGQLRRAGRSATVERVRRAGFETRTSSRIKGPFFEVEALDGGGHVIGRSQIVRVEARAKTKRA
ncbi:MAG: hypothetical protein ACYCSI_12090, partial [Solirubrobacteraceae bacterium]